jgi:hypothetical protein
MKTAPELGFKSEGLEIKSFRVAPKLEVCGLVQQLVHYVTGEHRCVSCRLCLLFAA